MKLIPLATATAALALLGGTAALSQQPATGVTPNRATPAQPSDSKTGVPSVDSSRPTGANAGKTNLPGGEVTSSTPAAERAGAATASGVITPGAVEPVVPGSATIGATSSANSSATISDSASSATSAGAPASVTATTTLTTNGPVPDTPANRRKYGQPLSRAGKMTAARGN
jgi:hypothetical protein